MLYEQPQERGLARAVEAGQTANLVRRLVWVNTGSGICHRPSTRWYGHTALGGYLPEWLARLEGTRAARNGQ